MVVTCGKEYSSAFYCGVFFIRRDLLGWGPRTQVGACWRMTGLDGNGPGKSEIMQPERLSDIFQAAGPKNCTSRRGEKWDWAFEGKATQNDHNLLLNGVVSALLKPKKKKRDWGGG